MNRRIFFALAALPTLAACSVVIGESFSGYTVAPSDASAESGSDGAGATDASTESGSDGARDGAMTMGNCTPACTGDHVVCDPADNQCKLDGTTSHVGDNCVNDGNCGSASNAACNDMARTDYPGGYCTVTMCTVNALCPIGAACAVLSGGSNACYKICNSTADCRPLEYECLPIDPFYVSGASHKICTPKALGCYVSDNCPTAKPMCRALDGGPTPDGGTGFCQ